MLTIFIEPTELFNEEDSTITTLDGVVLEMEHSLLSVSKWESIYQKPFLSSENKTPEEIFGYIRAMVITKLPDPNVLFRLSQDNIVEIQSYIDSSQSATTFGSMPERQGRGEVITAELIYYWMVGFSIPFECETWHLNRLFALIRICNIKNAPPEKLSRGEIARRNSELNAKRREQYGTSG